MTRPNSLVHQGVLLKRLCVRIRIATVESLALCEREGSRPFLRHPVRPLFFHNWRSLFDGVFLCGVQLSTALFLHCEPSVWYFTSTWASADKNMGVRGSTITELAVRRKLRGSPGHLLASVFEVSVFVA